jgi:hypothetical protein
MLPLNYLNRQQAASYVSERGLKMAPTTLAKLVTVGGGPAFRKWGRRPVYTPEDLDAWIVAKLGAPRRSSSEASA